ncbi:unnamed protein product, partial [Meganyctiphanes norvegica]
VQFSSSIAPGELRTAGNVVMRLRRNLRWWVKVVVASLIFLAGTYLTLRQAYRDAQVDNIEVNIREDGHIEIIDKNPKIKNLNEEDEQKIMRILEKAQEVKEFTKLPASSGYRDWNNYALIEAESHQKGPGENGAAYQLPAEHQHEKDALYKVNGFNARASDDIALNRSLNDIRHPKCKKKVYRDKLPRASVVVPFHNEHWTTLLRTAISTINRSPDELLEEVILVDDASTKEFLKDKLDKYVSENLPKVRVVHLAKRSGLIRARLAGAKEAKGDVIIFLDSHTECATNWLPPLLDPIAQDYRTCVCPFIDVIDYETFAYRAQDEGARGAFDWEFFYKRLPLLEEDKKNMPEPFKNPKMSTLEILTIFFSSNFNFGGFDRGTFLKGGEELPLNSLQYATSFSDNPLTYILNVFRSLYNYSVGYYIGGSYWFQAVLAPSYSKRRRDRQRIGSIHGQKAVKDLLRPKSTLNYIEEPHDVSPGRPYSRHDFFSPGRIQGVHKRHFCLTRTHKKHMSQIKNTFTCGTSQVGHLSTEVEMREARRVWWDISGGTSQVRMMAGSGTECGGTSLKKHSQERSDSWILDGHSHVRACGRKGNKNKTLVCATFKDPRYWIFEK